MDKPTITATGRLQFAIRFAYNTNLDTLRVGDLLNLQEDLAVFLGCQSGQSDTLAGKGGIVTAPLAHPLPAEFSPAHFRLLQQEARAILDALVHDGMLSMSMVKIEGYYSFFRSSKPSGFTVLSAQGATRDMFLLTLFFLLNQEPLDRIMRCPECQAIFYRIRKQQYCSRVCTNRANVRQWRHKSDNTSQEAERAHEHYVKKQASRIGPGGKVARFPRKPLSPSVTS